jgi:hypothetical protein
MSRQLGYDLANGLMPLACNCFRGCEDIVVNG